MVRFYMQENYLMKQLRVKIRLQIICLWYVLSLMVVSRKHSLDFAARLSGKERSQFSRFLKNHPDAAIFTLKELSRREARKWSKTFRKLESLPWRAAILIDLTGQRRSSLHSQNVQKHLSASFLAHCHFRAAA